MEKMRGAIPIIFTLNTLPLPMFIGHSVLQDNKT